MTDESTNQSSQATSDQQGHFSVTGLVPGPYTLEVSAPGFAAEIRKGVQAVTDRTEELSITLKIGSASEVVTVEANNSDSVAAYLAPMYALVDQHSARTKIKPVFIQNFTSPSADFGELVEIVPETSSIDPQRNWAWTRHTFAVFLTVDDDVDFDSAPFYDTSTPTHRTGAFFPNPWVGRVDFDRSPGSASNRWAYPFRGSIHLLSPEMKTSPLFQAACSYGSFNTILFDASYDSGPFLNKKSNPRVDVQQMTSDG